MNDARYLGLVLGFDEQDQAAVALGDDGFLHDGALLVAAQAALHNLVKLLVGRAGLAPQLAQFRTGVIQDFAGGADGPADGILQPAQVGDVAGHAGQQGQVVAVGQGLAVETGGGGQLLDLVQFFSP